MLVLARKVGERVVLGHDVVITVVSLDKGEVRLGFDAPDATPVHREEVYVKVNGAMPPTATRLRDRDREEGPRAERRRRQEEEGGC